MVNKWLCLSKVIGTHIWFPILSHRQGIVCRYKDFGGKRLKLHHPFPFAAPTKGHSHSHCNAVAHRKTQEEGSVPQSISVMSGQQRMGIKERRVV